MPKVNTRPIGENSPILVTLVGSHKLRTRIETISRKKIGTAKNVEDAPEKQTNLQSILLITLGRNLRTK
jgi:hypothetical protein